jgi:hypothetical protein
MPAAERDNATGGDIANTIALLFFRLPNYPARMAAGRGATLVASIGAK